MVDPVRLRSHGLAATDVSQAIAAQSVAIPGGRTLEPGKERVVKLETEARSVEELRDLVVASPGGKAVRVRDVANVVDGPAEARSAAELDGRAAVGLVVRKQSGANTVAVAEAVTRAPGRARGRCRPARGSSSSPTTRASSGARLRRCSTTCSSARSWRSWWCWCSCATGAPPSWRRWRCPTSVIGTFAAMHALGFTFNVITMLALTLSIGLLIDDAIVVIENMVRHLEKGSRPRRRAGRHRPDRAGGAGGDAGGDRGVRPGRLHEGAGGPVLLPVRRHGGGGGGHLVPGLDDAHPHALGAAAGAPRRGHGRGWAAALERFFQAVERGYRRALEWALDHRKATLRAAVGVLVATVGLGEVPPVHLHPGAGHEQPGGDAGAAGRHAARGDPARGGGALPARSRRSPGW